VSSSQSTNIVPSHVGLCLLLLLVGNLHSSLSKLHVQNLIIIMILIFILAIRHLVKFFVVPVATHEIYSLSGAHSTYGTTSSAVLQSSGEGCISTPNINYSGLYIWPYIIVSKLNYGKKNIVIWLFSCTCLK
jgi:hypothetical protein